MPNLHQLLNTGDQAIRRVCKTGCSNTVAPPSLYHTRQSKFCIIQGPHMLARLEGRFTLVNFQQVCTHHPNDVSRQHPNDVTMSAQLARHFSKFQTMRSRAKQHSCCSYIASCYQSSANTLLLLLLGSILPRNNVIPMCLHQALVQQTCFRFPCIIFRAITFLRPRHTAL